MKYFIAVILLFTLNFLYGQDFILNERYIQLSGLVMTSDSQKAIPNASVRIRGTYRGMSANMQGFYSMVVKEGDWIDITSVGYKRQSFQVPEGLTEPSYIKMLFLKNDTIVFSPVNIYPWPSREKFREAFMTVQVNKSYIQILEENFNRITMLMMTGTLLPDAQECQSRALRNYSSQLSGVSAGGGGIGIPIGSTKGYSAKKSTLPPLKW